ncbi:hypothetical protein L345_04573, partial [Ophiophagus hannah]
MAARRKSGSRYAAIFFYLETRQRRNEAAKRCSSSHGETLLLEEKGGRGAGARRIGGESRLLFLLGRNRALGLRLFAPPTGQRERNGGRGRAISPYNRFEGD